MTYLYDLKGFLNPVKLEEYPPENLIFKELSFSIKANFYIDDIHQVECIIKSDTVDKNPIFKGNIFSFSGIIKIIFLTTEENDSTTKLISKTESFLYSIPFASEYKILSPEPFKINFLVRKNEVRGNLSLVFIANPLKRNTENIRICEPDDVTIKAINSLFL